MKIVLLVVTKIWASLRFAWELEPRDLDHDCPSNDLYTRSNYVLISLYSDAL